MTNPGFATWNGPYLDDDFYASSGALESEFSIDGWGKAYSYSGSAATISSTGGTTTITKKIANSVDDLLYNTVSFNIIDLDLCPPGTIDKDSVQFRFTYPNGLGIYQTDSKFPTAGGFVSFDSIPIGQQSLSVFELKNNDTLTRKIYVNQNSSFHADIQFPKSLWRSEEHTSELQSHSFISYAVFCLKKKKINEIILQIKENPLIENLIL